MLDDGVKERNADSKLRVRDLAQILEEVVAPSRVKARTLARSESEP
jgi:hypothetical protein